MEHDTRDLRAIATELKRSGLRCNCDLDNWEPEHSGHSCVCRIHKRARAMKYRPYDIKAGS